MRLSVLAVSLLLVFSQSVLAQHSSGGGGGFSAASAGSSAGSSGGGSHSSGSSGGSSGGHSSSGSASHGSSSHGSSGGGKAASSTVHAPHSNATRTTQGPKRGEPVTTESERSGKRSFFSFFRHPFRKPQPRPVSDFRPKACFGHLCRVCPAGASTAGGACPGISVAPVASRCSSWGVWSGNSCLRQTPFLQDCSAQRMALQRQQQRVQASELTRQNACAAGSSQECSERTSEAQSEANLHRVLQEELRRCEQGLTARPYGGARSGAYLRPSFDTAGIDLMFP
jgi:hypothetical protein